MSSGESCTEPRPTWREKLNHTIFGSHASASDDAAAAALAAAPKPHASHASSSQESLTSNNSCRTSSSAAAAGAAATIAASPQPISEASSSLLHTPPAGMEQIGETTSVVTSRISASPRHDTSIPTILAAEEKDKESDKSSSSSSRRKQLSTIFAAWRPASTKHPDRVAGRSEMRPKRADSGSASSGVDSEPLKSPSISQSITHGVRSLQERHRLNREAAENFKTMKAEEGSASRESHDRSSSPSKTGIEQVSAAFDVTVIPEEMIRGEMMLKVTPKKVKQRMFRLDSDRGQIYWESKRNNIVNLESIREVRTGAAAASYRSSMSISPSHEARWISIIYQTGGVYKAVHLIALSDEAFRRWKETLSAVQNERKMLLSGIDLLDQRQQLWLRQHWKAADSSQNSQLDFVEVTKLCRRLGILSNGRDLLHRFQQADTQGKGFLNYEDFQHFVTLLKRRIDLEVLFLHWADVDVKEDPLQHPDFSSEEGLELTREKLHAAVEQASMRLSRVGSFLVKAQGYSAEEAVNAVDLIMSRYGHGNQLDHAGFVSFLMSSDNAVIVDQSLSCSKEASASMKERGNAQTTDELIAISSVEKTTQDMTRPLSEYYISSSHNTYLVGGQWKGDSTVEGYIRALMQGARSVEIDCWNGPGNEPQVTHGRTLTSKVPFRDVIVAIERYAFKASPFPLILSLEVHNDIAQQEVLATILRDVLGDKLLSAPLERPQDALQSLPSPRDLKGKVLVKAKNLLVPEAVPPAGDVGIDDMPLIMAEKRSDTCTTDTTESESDHLLQSARGLVRSVTKRKLDRQNEGEAKGQPTKVLMSPLLASLLIYTIGVKHRGINKKEHYAVEHMISLSEKSGLKYLKSNVNCEDLIKHNRSHLTRVYPSMSSYKRLSLSANFLPSLFWCIGCQLVAINWQTLDIGFEMNQAMFSRNGRCGYVLKPEALRVKEASKSSNTTDRSKKMTVQVSVRIISAQQLPRFRDASRDRELDNDEVIDPFVSLCVVVPQHRDYSVKNVKPSLGSKRKHANGIQSLLSEVASLKDPSSSSPLKPCISMSSEGSAAAPPPPSPTTKRSWLCRQKTSVVKANGFNPIWNETLSFSITFKASASTITADTDSIQAHTRGILDLCFLRFEVAEKVKVSSSSRSGQGGVSTTTSGDSSGAVAGGGHESDDASQNDDEVISASDDEESSLESLGEGAHCLATHMISLGSLAKGYRHVPLYDAQLSQYLYSTLFIKTDMQLVETPS